MTIDPIQFSPTTRTTSINISIIRLIIHLHRILLLRNNLWLRWRCLKGMLQSIWKHCGIGWLNFVFREHTVIILWRHYRNWHWHPIVMARVGIISLKIFHTMPVTSRNYTRISTSSCWTRLGTWATSWNDSWTWTRTTTYQWRIRSGMCDNMVMWKRLWYGIIASIDATTQWWISRQRVGLRLYWRLNSAAY